ncbi:hypothetical protein QT196_11750 [Streptomyces sp. P9-2B-2]|uniref:hypothetical protein n=1 Tax=Streptomyces sp. P9-2B-2 TaxID=3057114 RepID=UPI0025B62231|nr:hypothetical protein [Streptomyces sp. P9-2B-2]WJY37907.1 hypothetical protein QT196_11750 [Streptomyces sp. P9-2B-2]
MGFNSHDVVTLKLDCAGWHHPYIVDITRMQLGEILLKLDDMAADTDEQATPDHAQKWPSADEAYAAAPSISSENDWAIRTADEWADEGLDREWYLRHAAVLDRIALRDDADQRTAAAEDADATATVLLDLRRTAAVLDADAAATVLLDLDQASRGYDPRAYVRQQYALWAAEQPSDPCGTSSD